MKRFWSWLKSKFSRKEVVPSEELSPAEMKFKFLLDYEMRKAGARNATHSSYKDRRQEDVVMGGGWREINDNLLPGPEIQVDFRNY